MTTDNFETHVAPSKKSEPAMDDQDTQEFRRTLKEIREGQAETSKALHDAAIQLARLDERQQETTSKVNAIQLAMSNNYVGSIEFGMVKKDLEDLEREHGLENQRLWLKVEDMQKDREDDRKWFIRTTIGGAITFAFALALMYVKVKGG